jgi:uncharacterized protein with HEPN domain
MTGTVDGNGKDRVAQKRRRWLHDIMSYESIRQRAKDETAKRVIADANVHDAIYYRLQCISEATRKLLLIDPSLLLRYPESPCTRVRAIGNVIRHEYGEIETSAIWELIACKGDRLRDLLSVARRELKILDA